MAGTITFTPQERDALIVQHLRMRGQLRSPRTLATYAAVIGIVGALCYWDNRQEGSMPAAWAAAGTMLVAAIGIILVLALCFIASRAQARRVFAERKAWRQPQDIAWNEQGFVLRTDAAQVQARWSDYLGWFETRHGVLLQATSLDLALLPARAFGPGQREDLIATLRAAGVPQSARSRPAENAHAVHNQKTRWWRREAVVPLMWLALAVLATLLAVAFPQAFGLDQAIAATGAPVLAALLAGWLLGRRSDVWRLAPIFLGASMLLAVAALIDAWRGNTEDPGAWAGGMIAVILALWIWEGFAGRPWQRRMAAVAAVLGTLACAAALSHASYGAYQLSRALQPYLPGGVPAEDENAPATSPLADVLWGMQPELLAKAAAGLKRAPAGNAPHVRALAIAADGTQDQFGREASLALDMMARRYGQAWGGGIVLSNSAFTQNDTPLATRANLAAAAQAMAAHGNPARDWAFVYLVSHGGPDATLQTQTSEYDELTPIDAQAVDRALKDAGIRRRVIVVSACYAGSWIRPLANPDTIVIAAARHDRTSFGCGAGNALTYFGEAFLEGPLAQGTSLQSVFETTRRAVAAREKAIEGTPSVPQVFVGARMADIWTQPVRRD